MNLDLCPEAIEYGREALRALGAAGGDKLSQLAEQQPDRRDRLVAPVLADLGAWDLDPRGDPNELEAAAALCRSCGCWCAPYPVAERLSRPAEFDGLVVVADSAPAAAIAGVDLRWAAITLDGRRGVVAGVRPTSPARNCAFVADLDVVEVTDVDPREAALGLVLPCWTLVGMVDRALELAVRHVLVRSQFGQPLAKFQGVQFQLTEAAVERDGVAALATYALWSVQTGRPEAVADALAARLAAVEAAEVVFRVTQQVHGAIGFCDETPLSWLTRYSRPLRQLPFGASGTRQRLARQVGRRGLAGLFSA